MLTFDPFRDPFRGFDRIAGDLRGSSRAMMAFDAVRNDDEVNVYFDVPGVAAEDIEVSVEKNELTVTVERRWSTDAQDENNRVIHSERPQGTFTRRLMLSDALDTDHLEANLEEGVLTVTVPVAESSKERRIEVRSGGGRSAIETTGTEHDQS